MVVVDCCRCCTSQMNGILVRLDDSVGDQERAHDDIYVIYVNKGPRCT